MCHKVIFMTLYIGEKKIVYFSQKTKGIRFSRKSIGSLSRPSCLSEKITCSLDLYWVLEASDFQLPFVLGKIEKRREKNNDNNIGELFLLKVFATLAFFPPSGGAVKLRHQK